MPRNDVSNGCIGLATQLSQSAHLCSCVLFFGYVVMCRRAVLLPCVVGLLCSVELAVSCRAILVEPSCHSAFLFVCIHVCRLSCSCSLSQAALFLALLAGQMRPQGDVRDNDGQTENHRREVEDQGPAEDAHQPQSRRNIPLLCGDSARSPTETSKNKIRKKGLPLG